MMEVKEDIIELLLKRNLIEVVFDIFKNLDNVTFVNCKLVCKMWNQFIDFHFHETKKGRTVIQTKLKTNFFQASYLPRMSSRVLISNMASRRQNRDSISGIQMDKFSISVSKWSGSLSNYDFKTLKHLWTVKICEFAIRHYLTSEKIFAGKFFVKINYKSTSEKRFYVKLCPTYLEFFSYIW